MMRDFRQLSSCSPGRWRVQYRQAVSPHSSCIGDVSVHSTRGASTSGQEGCVFVSVMVSRHPLALKLLCVHCGKTRTPLSNWLSPRNLHTVSALCSVVVSCDRLHQAVSGWCGYRGHKLCHIASVIRPASVCDSDDLQDAWWLLRLQASLPLWDGVCCVPTHQHILLHWQISWEDYVEVWLQLADCPSQSLCRPGSTSPYLWHSEWSCYQGQAAQYCLIKILNTIRQQQRSSPLTNRTCLWWASGEHQAAAPARGCPGLPLFCFRISTCPSWGALTSPPSWCPLSWSLIPASCYIPLWGRVRRLPWSACGSSKLGK